MNAIRCSSCGDHILQAARSWAVVEPGSRHREDQICDHCLEEFESSLPILFVYRNWRQHRATVLSECGIRLARQDMGLELHHADHHHEHASSYHKAA